MSKKLINGKLLAVQLGRNETQIALVGKNSEILHGITVPTPMGAVEDGMIHNQEAVTELLKEALQIPEFKGVRQVVFSLCTSQVIMETTTTPNLPKAKLEKLILANADMYFPVDIRDYRLIWEVVDVKKNDAGTKEASVQLWAVPNEMLRPYYLAANACGLSVAAIDYCGHSAATAVGATFARPVKPPKAKAAKDPAAPKEPKPKKKIDWNAEITFGKKKKVEPELPQEEAGPRVIPATDMHILMDNELLGLTFVQEGQVVYQRFYRCGADPSYQFSELAMMVEYFQTQDIGRDSEIRGYVSGPGSVDTDMVELLAGMLGIPLAAFQTGADPRWLLCAGAARTTLEFGNPEFNKVVRVSRTINTDLWQYAAILASGAALVMVVMMLLNARLGWNSEVSSLENEYTILSGQAAQVNGFKKNYDDYVTSYDAYDRDWDALFNSLHTYNDNLVFVLKELETVMPENTSVTDIIIDSDSVMISFACDDKEEAAYLIMSLRDMEYVDVNTISNLIGGGKGAATEYGTPIEEVTPPTEGGSEEEAYSPTQEELEALTKNYSQTPAIKNGHTSIATYKETVHAPTFEERKMALEGMLATNPFIAKPFIVLIMKDAFTVDGTRCLSEEMHSEISSLMGLGLPTTQADQLALIQKAMDVLAKDDANLQCTENLMLADKDVEVTYIHYMEAAQGLWNAPVDEESGNVDFLGYCPYIKQDADLETDTSPAAVWLKAWIAGDTRPDRNNTICICCEDIHVDADKDSKCDVCDADVCDHPKDKFKYTQVGNTMHTVICECGEVIEENARCSDNGTGYCDCGRDARDLCQHTNTNPPAPDNNGTSHSTFCNDCGESWKQNCSDENEDCICDACMGEMLHGDIDITPTAGKNAHNYVCNICKKEWQEQTPCADADGNELCDICGSSLAFTRVEIDVLKDTHGKEPQPNEGSISNYEGYKEYLEIKKPTYFEREAAIINLFTANAFAANDYIEEVAEIFIPEYEIAENAEFKSVQSAMEVVKLYLQSKPVDENEEKLAQIEELIFNTSDPEKYNAKMAYHYYLEVAMGRKAEEHPHLIEKNLGNMEDKTDAERERILATWEYVNSINKTLTKSRANYEDFLYYYLMANDGDQENLKALLGSEMLEDLNAYFDDDKSKWEVNYNTALTNSELLRKILIQEFLYNYYQENKQQSDTLHDLIESYRNDLIDYNEALALMLKQCEREAEITKDINQDEKIAQNEKDIANLKKELESLKKAASDKAEEEAEGGAGGGGAKGDTRVFLDIGLLYTEELWDQELQRKGLDRNAKIPKLELEVAG